MSKKSRRESRRNRLPRVERYSSSGDTHVVEYVDGSRTVELSGQNGDYMREVLASMAADFEAQFGRPPGPTDPVFWKNENGHPAPLTEEDVTKMTVEVMRAADIDPAIIYAYEQTDLLASEENWPLLTASDRLEWEAAIAEFDAAN